MSPVESLSNPVRVKYSDDNTFIFLTINPRDVVKQGLTPEQVLDALIESGFSSFEYQLEQDILDDIVALPWHRLNKVIVRRIAFRIEFDIKLHLSPDQMQAFLTIKHAFHEELISRERLLERLAHAGIKQGLNEDILEAILEANEAQSVLIAEGKEPVHARDGWAERLVHPLNLLDELVLPVGTPLMRIHPPQPGVDGYTVTGRVLPSIEGQTIQSKPGVGCVFSETDPGLMVSIQEGIPLFSKNSVMIDELHYLHLDELEDKLYTHSIEISGDVLVDSSIKIETCGHLIIRGNIHSGMFISGAELLITGDVLGPVWLQSVDQMSLQSVREALIHCVGTLSVQDSLEHCQVYLWGALYAPEAWLSGGLFYFSNKLILHQLGQPGNIPTSLERDSTGYFLNRLQYIQTERKYIKDKLELILKNMIRNPYDYKTRGQRFKEAQNLLMKQDEAYIREEEKLIQEQGELEITVLDTVYPGVTLSYDSIALHSDEARRAQIFKPDVFGPDWQPLHVVTDAHPEDHTE